MVDHLHLQIGLGQGHLFPLLPLWVMDFKTPITTRYRMNGSIVLLSTLCQTFLPLSLMCPFRRRIQAKLLRVKPGGLVKRSGELLLFLRYRGEKRRCPLTTLFIFPMLRFAYSYLLLVLDMTFTQVRMNFTQSASAAANGCTSILIAKPFLVFNHIALSLVSEPGSIS